MKRLLNQLAHLGEISWLSYHFAEFIAAQAKVDIDDPLALSTALLCDANQNGNVCINLAQLADKPLFQGAMPGAGQAPRAAPLAAWKALLRESPCVGEPGERAPLILDQDRLYLHRHWFYEDAVAKNILSLLLQAPADATADIGDRVASLFDRDRDTDQQHAVLTAASRRFCVISGGPGSGKTSTVIRILALMTELRPGCRIALAAPTGKAAARMMESIRTRIDQIEISKELREALATEAGTIHRLLGARWQGFEHHAQNPLAYDYVIVDEASMIDLELMYHLLSALPRHAGLVLLGDRDQLASVAAGNVLGDITGNGLEPGAAAIADSIVLLRQNYRFARDSAIAKLAAQVNRGDRTAVAELLQQNARGLWWYRGGGEDPDPDAMRWILDAYRPVFDCAAPADALDIYESARVLCATNMGTLGSDTLNTLISRALLAQIGKPESEYCAGMPIMITRNHHGLGLFNGDTGILWQTSAGLRACFRDGEGGIRELSLNRLPRFVVAWATTVHKSQGSEFDSVLLLLPTDAGSEALSRELLYTAATRARREFRLQATAGVVDAAVTRMTRRDSGLALKLGWLAAP